MATLAGEEDLWLHVDGCIGALIAIAPENAYRVAGIEKADSLALDPHKWLHAPFEAGCALVRDACGAPRRLCGDAGISGVDARGLASGDWLNDYGLQTSRGFQGAQDLDVAQGAWRREVRPPDRPEHRAGPLSCDLIEAEPLLELVAPTNINIVCYRYRSARIDGAD